MRIALDWDDTVTRDPKMWMQFVWLARKAGHDVRIVTMRYPRELDDVKMLLSQHNLEDLQIICTERDQKRPATERHGWLPHVWIDDTPEFIVAMPALIGADR